MSGLLALLLGLAGVAYAAWPLLNGRPWAPPARRHEALLAEEVEDFVNALRDWSAAAGEVGIGKVDRLEDATTGRVGDE